jgi:MoxR-like ATPase
MEGQTYTIQPPFLVFATQNPVDYEGTFPLPESQMDRFLMRLQMGYPAFDDELSILKSSRTRYDQIDTNPVVSRNEIMEVQHMVRRVFVEDSVLEFILRIVQATRTESEFSSGVSPRGALSLKIAAQASALFEGRGFVIPEDIYRVVAPVFVHRLNLRRQSSDALEERRTVESMLARIVNNVPSPS